MKTIVVVILAGLLAVPIVSWGIYGSMGEILPWFGLIGFLGLVYITVTSIQKKKWF